MKIITTKEGQEVLVDDEDFEQLSKYKWHIHDGYACRATTVAGKSVRYRMHRIVLGLPPGDIDKRIVDHINRNRLDNRKENLRVVDALVNSQNAGLRSDNTHGCKGVVYLPKRYAVKKWKAAIRHKGEKIYIGYFETKEEARIAYESKALELRGFI